MSEQVPLSILYAEDEPEVREAMATLLRFSFADVQLAADGAEALSLFRERPVDVVVTDVRMPRLDGLGLAEQLREEAPDVPVILTTAFTEVPYLLRAIELGVRGFVRKPIDFDELRGAIRRAGLPAMQQREIANARAAAAAAMAQHLGTSPSLARAAEQAWVAAAADAPAILEGEVGTGRARLASLIHDLGPRQGRPFVTVQCADRKAAELDEELFGRGREMVGGLAAAGRGTLVVCNLEAIALPLQAKLLRALEQGHFFPVGGRTSVRLEARLLATVRDSAAARQEGRLLAGLYSRLADQVIHLPPLREISSDLAALALRFLREGAGDYRRPIPFLTDDAISVLHAHAWPGNIGELRNIMRRALLLATGRVTGATLRRLLDVSFRPPALSPAEPPAPSTLADLERWAIVQALERSGGKKMPAAAMLGLDYKRFKRMLARHGFPR